MIEELSPAQLHPLLQASPQAMLLIDNSGHARWINDQLAELLGAQATEIINHSIDEVPEPLQNLFIENSTIHLSAEKNSDDIWLLTTTQTLAEEGGILQSFTDISAIQQLIHERDQLADELEEYILVDNESGMPNQRALYQSLESQVSRSRRYQNPLSIILLRLNNLDDYINASQNKNPASLFISLRYMLNEQLRWADIIGRLNENELLMVLPETQANDALMLAQKISQRVKTLELPELEADTDAENLQLDAQFGVSEWRKGDDVALLMTRTRSQLEQELAKEA